MTEATGSSTGTSLDPQRVREVLGYLNFSNGTPDPSFAESFSALWAAAQTPDGCNGLYAALVAEIDRLSTSTDAFRNSDQAHSILRLVYEKLFPAYRDFHADLLFHVSEERLDQPFLLVRMIESVLAQGPPWTEEERVVSRALERLNDFVGFRPVATLENGLRSEPYAHERFRPLPLYIRGAGVAAGPYQELIEQTIRFLRETPVEVMREAHFDLDRIDELAVDIRAHDHTHPVNKRTNYMFGEWDPHVIDTSGFYRRFIIRQMILDAMLSWMDAHQDMPEEERYYDASAVLCGTMLMASAISGCGPDTHDSTVTLTSLLPRVARQRDTFYDRLLSEATGERRERLMMTAEKTQQPFGHVRQHLNMYLAGYGARQVQHRQLAQLYARMGYPTAAREEAAIIPSASSRFECEIQWRLTLTQILLKKSRLDEATRLLDEVEDLMHRGIDCGALVDPWNVLGFQAQFPLFAAREDSVPDHRIDALLELKEQLFSAYSHAMCVAAAAGQPSQLASLSEKFAQSAAEWDRFATPTVEDLLKVYGQDSWESARHVSTALAQWREAGEEAGNISFWRQHVTRFQSAKSYAQVVDALLEIGDHVATMGLLMQWLDQWDDVGLESGGYSIYSLLTRWIRMVVSEDQSPQLTREEQWTALQRLFAYLEANAGSLWNAPALTAIAAGIDGSTDVATDPIVEENPLQDLDDEPEPDESDLFQAAYDSVIFEDSADDGQIGDTMDSGFLPGNTEFELMNRQLEPRLRFLMTVAQLWQTAAIAFADWGADDLSETQQEQVLEWAIQSRRVKQDLLQLLRDIWDREIEIETGDLDANVEYDVQLQTKFYMLQTTIATYLGCEVAERVLGGLVPSDRLISETTDEQRDVIAIYRGVLRRDTESVRRLLPGLIERISIYPLLYVPFDNGGGPQSVLRARCLQTLIRFLLEQLPRLGMLEETLKLLRTAYRMERSSRPAGLAVTEFDRLFRTALRNSLLCLVASAETEEYGDEELIELLQRIVEPYRRLWLQHSKTMRLSTVEELHDEELAESTRAFIETYGADLFHARHLTLGNIRAILHNGVDTYLEYLADNHDGITPFKLLDDLDEGDITLDEAAEQLELVYEIIVDKFERFLEYNTTTTQSDYGERIYSLLEFLRVEAEYDRHAWELAPLRIAHQVLSHAGLVEASEMWERRVEKQTAAKARKHLKRLRALEDQHGMQLPSIADRLNERFIKPLALNRMAALVAPACHDAQDEKLDSECFAALRNEINAYLQDTSGSGIDVPPWLRTLEKELVNHEEADGSMDRDAELPIELPPTRLSRADLNREVDRIGRRSATKRGSRKRG